MYNDSRLKRNKQIIKGLTCFTGIDICTWTVKAGDEHLTYSVWDFAGQTVYYNTHQVYITSALQGCSLCLLFCYRVFCSRML